MGVWRQSPKKLENLAILSSFLFFPQNAGGWSLGPSLSESLYHRPRQAEEWKIGNDVENVCYFPRLMKIKNYQNAR